MNMHINRPTPTNNSTTWRPTGWIVGDPDEPYTPEDRTVDGVVIPGIEKRYKEFEKAGFFTRGGSLTDRALGKKDEQEARDVLTNHKLLRDAWNTHPAVWQLAECLTGQQFRVDPFWNPGCRGVEGLAVTLDGTRPLQDGLLTVAGARELIADPQQRDKFGGEVIAELARRLAVLGDDVPDGFPVNWRQDLAPGSAAAIANGPHSNTARWLAVTQVYSTQEITASFVPYCGDGWFQQIALGFALIVHLGRVPCSPPPGVQASQPRGASALLIGIPPAIKQAAIDLHAEVQELDAAVEAASPRKRDALALERDDVQAKLDATLPAATRALLRGGPAFRSPWLVRSKIKIQYAVVQRGDLDEAQVVDFGLVG